MIRAAGQANAWCTVTPVADSSDVLAALVQEEDVCSAVPALRSPLEASASRGEAFKVKLVVDCEQEIDVLRIRLVCRQGTDQRDPRDAGKLARCHCEGEGLVKEELAQRQVTIVDPSHEETVPCAA
jgi:hypothetical protein